MSRDPFDAVLSELFARQVHSWLPGALRRSRRVTLALAYAGRAGLTVESVLRGVTHAGDGVRGHRLTVVVLGDDPGLPSRLDAAASALPAEVTVHVVPGGAARLPVALRAAGAAGAPLLTLVDDPGGSLPVDPAGASMLAAAASGRPADILLALPAEHPSTAALAAAGFPLVAEVGTLVTDGSHPRLIAFATRSDRSLEAFKESLWHVGAASGLRRRDETGTEHVLCAQPDPGPLAVLLAAELSRSGPRTVTELRRHALTATPFRAADAVRALGSLLDAGAATREPEHGRLAGDVVIHPATPGRFGAPIGGE